MAGLGPWVRLEGISIGRLPPGGRGVKPSLEISSSDKFSDGSGSVAAPNIKTFITNVLSEAVTFIDGVAPRSGGVSTWKSKGPPKTYSSSDAPVHLYERRVPGKDLDKIEGMTQFSADRKDETWFCRRSCHQNKSQIRTASWEEFKHSFKDHHAESEMAFTPTVIGAREAMRWDTNGIEVEVQGERWIKPIVVVEEMKHKIDPKPLKNRTFPVVQIAAELIDTQEFLVVSIPLTDFEKSPYSEYARDKGLVVAAYASIERIRILPSNGDIEWIMATASDAGGMLPQWVQNLAVPSAVAKDVDMFLNWIAGQRTGLGQTGSKSESRDHKTTPPISPAKDVLSSGSKDGGLAPLENPNDTSKALPTPPA